MPPRPMLPTLFSLSQSISVCLEVNGGRTVEAERLKVAPSSVAERIDLPLRRRKPDRGALIDDHLTWAGMHTPSLVYELWIEWSSSRPCVVTRLILRIMSAYTQNKQQCSIGWRSSLVFIALNTRKPCFRKETARCRSCSFRFKVRRQHSLQV